MGQSQTHRKSVLYRFRNCSILSLALYSIEAFAPHFAYFCYRIGGNQTARW